jgi:chemotaxis signal transduction protein
MSVDPPLPWLLFSRREQSFVVPVRAVRSIVPGPKLSPFPSRYPSMLGVFAHRGRVYPLLDVLDTQAPATFYAAMVAIVTQSELGDVGLVSDVVHGFVAEAPSDTARLDPSTLARKAREFMRRAPRVT